MKNDANDESTRLCKENKKCPFYELLTLGCGDAAMGPILFFLLEKPANNVTIRQ